MTESTQSRANDSGVPGVFRDGGSVVMPAFASAHSHSFHRVLRETTQRRASTRGSFWSWRGQMYRLVEQLEPDDVFSIAQFAFVELAMSGVTAIGEFHYLHHTPNGTPYEDRITLSDAVIRAARAAGMRITLIRSAYFRAGFGHTLDSAQRRFCDPSVDLVFQDVETLQRRFRDDPLVNITTAVHSIRAVRREQVNELAQFAHEHKLPLHMHVSEQQREIEECQGEYNLRPVELLAEDGVLSPSFVAIHATRLTAQEIDALGKSGSSVCLCRVTERDVGDGLPETAELIKAGATICVGIDTHCTTDSFENVRAIEHDERSRVAARHVAAEAPELLEMATRNSFQAIGMESAGLEDRVYLNANDPSIVSSKDDLLTDAVVFGATPRAVDKVVIGGNTVVSEGVHVNYEEALMAYQQTLKRLDC